MDVIDFTLKAPFLLGLYSPSGVGKTTTAIRLVKERHRIISPAPAKVYFIYAFWQPIFNQISLEDPDVTFTTSIESLNDCSVKDCLIILDDQDILSRNSKSQKVLQNFATRASHHTNSSVVYTSHSLFSPSLRLIQLNTQYFCVYKFARDLSAISHLSRQLSPGNSSYINSAYRRAVDSREQGAYLFINLHNRDGKARYWLRNNIFPDPETEVYLSRD